MKAKKIQLESMGCSLRLGVCGVMAVDPWGVSERWAGCAECQGQLRAQPHSDPKTHYHTLHAELQRQKFLLSL